MKAKCGGGGRKVGRGGGARMRGVVGRRRLSNFNDTIVRLEFNVKRRAVCSDTTEEYFSRPQQARVLCSVGVIDFKKKK